MFVLCLCTAVAKQCTDRSTCKTAVPGLLEELALHVSSIVTLAATKKRHAVAQINQKGGRRRCGCNKPGAHEWQFSKPGARHDWQFSKRHRRRFC
jgi:hypothetical protein